MNPTDIIYFNTLGRLLALAGRKDNGCTCTSPGTCIVWALGMALDTPCPEITEPMHTYIGTIFPRTEMDVPISTALRCPTRVAPTTPHMRSCVTTWRRIVDGGLLRACETAIQLETWDPELAWAAMYRGASAVFC